MWGDWRVGDCITEWLQTKALYSEFFTNNVSAFLEQLLLQGMRRSLIPVKLWLGVVAWSMKVNTSQFSLTHQSSSKKKIPKTSFISF